MESKKVVILFSRLSDYMMHMFEVWVVKYNVDLFIFKKIPLESQAPFKFNLEIENIRFFNEENLNSKEILNQLKIIKPNLIICSGWANKKYNKVIGEMNTNVKCILTMDNRWNGRIRQFFGIVYGQLILRKKFSKIWVPGKPQVDFARLLGFSRKDIITGLYVANYKKFEMPRNAIKKQFVFVGRYIEYKGIKDLCTAFINLDNRKPNDWVLKCIGKGPLEGLLPKHERIKHLGFMQPSELMRIAKEGGVFILPSHFEPWGVVVQEFALSGFPIIVSDKVGSASTFVNNNNGCEFRAGNVRELSIAMEKMMLKEDERLLKMGRSSQENASKISEVDWLKKINKELETS